MHKMVNNISKTCVKTPFLFTSNFGLNFFVDNNQTLFTGFRQFIHNKPTIVFLFFILLELFYTHFTHSLLLKLLIY